MALTILQTRRFHRSYQDGTIPIRDMVKGAIHDFVRLYSESPQECLRKYQRMAGTRLRLIEFKIAGGPRMICHWEPPRLTLVEVGTHDLPKRFDERDVATQVSEAVEAPSLFWPGVGAEFFSNLPSHAIGQFGNESSPDWIYFLDEEQGDIAQTIYDSSLKSLLGGQARQVHCIIGGPGTGKTTILLNLWARFREEGPFDAKLELLPQVEQYVEASTSTSVTHGSARSCEVLLVDDPPSLALVSSRASSTPDAKVLVFALDPLQLAEAVGDQEYSTFLANLAAKDYVLHSCYRQKENVGVATKRAADAIARSTPFLRGDKKALFWQSHARLTALANDLRFRNPHGYVKTYTQATTDDFRNELNRVATKCGKLWRHWPPLTIVLDDPSIADLPSEWKSVLEDLRRRHRLDVEICPRSEAQDRLKGVEYQHVFLVLSAKLYTEVENGFEGSGKRLYNERRLLRIPFSRAKDSLVTFVLAGREISTGFMSSQEDRFPEGLEEDDLPF
jgi:hypothetical protein